LVLAAVVSTGLACGSKLPLPENPRELVKLLENPDRRDRAACRLLELQRYRVKPRYTEDVCKSIEGEVNHVILAPQADGTSVYIVFRNPRYPSEDVGPGKPKGPFTLIDSGGLDSTPTDGGCCPYGSAIERFVTERRKLPVPGDPSAVRKNDCGKGITITQ
jgi:hypothetical protein